MDADVLYDENILHALMADPDKAVDRLLIDRDFEAGDEPVKLCVKNGVPVELRKQLAVDLRYDTIGESVGFFRFTEAPPRAASRRSSRATSTAARANMPHEEAVRDLLLEGGHFVRHCRRDRFTMYRDRLPERRRTRHARNPSPDSTHYRKEPHDERTVE